MIPIEAMNKILIKKASKKSMAKSSDDKIKLVVKGSSICNEDGQFLYHLDRSDSLEELRQALDGFEKELILFQLDREETQALDDYRNRPEEVELVKAVPLSPLLKLEESIAEGIYSINSALVYINERTKPLSQEDIDFLRGLEEAQRGILLSQQSKGNVFSVIEADNPMGQAMVTCHRLSRIAESTPAKTIASETKVIAGDEVPIFSVGIRGNGQAEIQSIDLVLADLADSTGLDNHDFTELRVYGSVHSDLDKNSQLLTKKKQIELGTATSIELNIIPPANTESFFIVTAVLRDKARSGHVFSVSFPAGGLHTSEGDIGAGVWASENQRLEIALSESTKAATVEEEKKVAAGEEVQLFSIGIRGNGAVAVEGIDLVLSDLTDATGLDENDLVDLHIYGNSSLTLKNARKIIGSQTKIKLGGVTLLEFNDTPPAGVEWFYIVTVAIKNTAQSGHAFTVEFPASGLHTSIGDIGTGIQARVGKRIKIAISESTQAAISHEMKVSAGKEIQLLRVGICSDGTVAIEGINIELSDLKDPTGIDASDFVELRVYSNSRPTYEDAGSPITIQAWVELGGVTQLEFHDRPSPKAERFFIVTAVMRDTAKKGKAFKVGFAAGGLRTSLGCIGTAVSASDSIHVEISGKQTTPSEGDGKPEKDVGWDPAQIEKEFVGFYEDSIHDLTQTIHEMDDDEELSSEQVVKLKKNVASAIEIVKDNINLVSASLLRKTGNARLFVDHIMKTQLLAIEMAMNMKGEFDLTDEDVEKIGMAALIQDLSILQDDYAPFVEKKEPLSGVDLVDIYRHPQDSRKLISIGSSVPEDVPEIILGGHERKDGSGYYKVKGDNIHKLAQILSVANMHIAMISPRPYRASLDPHKSVRNLIFAASAGKIETEVVKGLLDLVSMYPVGVHVTLESGEIARVVSANEGQFTKPWIRIIRSADGKTADQLVNLGDKRVDLRIKAYSDDLEDATK